MHLDPHREFTLGEWHVTPIRGVIRGPQGSRKLTPKAVDVLLCLIRADGQVVARDRFVEEVWDGRAFSDDPLNKCIAELRRQLGDTRGAPNYIETIPKRGYRLVADYTPVGDDAETTATVESADGRLAQPVMQKILAVALLIVIALLVWQLNRPGPLYEGDVALAVLPFATATGDDSWEYFADGMHEELIATLSLNSSLAVKPRSLTVDHRDTAPAAVADALGVQVLVTGSVRADDERIRVSVQLIDPAADVQIWAANFDRRLTMSDLFDLQSDIALDIARALQLTLTSEAGRTATDMPTDNLDAYDQFMLGKYHYRRKLPGDIRASVDNFEAAVALDPTFTEAWDWLAYAYNHAATAIGYMRPADAYPKARMAALRALELDPQLATSISILGYIRAVYDWDWRGAEADLRRAMDIDSHDSGTVWSLAHVLSMLGEHDEAIALTRQFADANTDSGRNYQEVANRLMDAGRYRDALSTLDVALAKGGEPADNDDARGIAYFALGDLAQAIVYFERAVASRQRDASTVARLCHSYARAGRNDDAERLLQELLQRSAEEFVPSLTLATAYVGMGHTDDAIRLIEQSAEERQRGVLAVAYDPFFATLRGHPRFDALTARIAANR